MKLQIVASVLLASSVSQADIIKCHFTEPFFSTTYSMTQSTLTYKSSEGKTKILRNVSFQIKGPARFDLVAKDGKVLQSLVLNNQGSNGMSDTVYPFEVKDNSTVMMANGGYGGCTSNYLKAKEPGQ